MIRQLVLALMLFVSLHADGATDLSGKTRYYVPDMPADFSQVEFYLLTVGVGGDLASRFGHTGLRIRDAGAKTDVVFNWGKFSFDEPGFGWKFFRGTLVYSLGVRTFQGEIDHQTEEGRPIVQERLQLTTEQKRKLMTKVAWNAEPKNRDFDYQYWYSNCSTMPRDYLDEALGGLIKAHYAKVLTPRRFRDFVRANLQTIPFMVPLLDVLMNGNIDQPVTEWDEMFLPAKLREHLARMPSVDDRGELVPGTSLLVESQVLLEHPETFQAPFNDYAASVLPIWLSLAVAGVLYLRRRCVTPGVVRAVGVSTLWFGLLFGFLGSTLALNWAFSGHPDGWRNVNLLLFFPVDALAILLGWRLLKTGLVTRDLRPFFGAARILAGLHVVALILLVALTQSGMVFQDVVNVSLFGGTAMVAALTAVSAMPFAPLGVSLVIGDGTRRLRGNDMQRTVKSTHLAR